MYRNFLNTMCVCVCVCVCDVCVCVTGVCLYIHMLKNWYKKKNEKQERKTTSDSEASNQNVLPDTAIFPGQKVHLFFAVVCTVPFMPSVLLWQLCGVRPSFLLLVHRFGEKGRGGVKILQDAAVDQMHTKSNQHHTFKDASWPANMETAIFPFAGFVGLSYQYQCNRSTFSGFQFEQPCFFVLYMNAKQQRAGLWCNIYFCHTCHSCSWCYSTQNAIHKMAAHTGKVLSWLFTVLYTDF